MKIILLLLAALSFAKAPPKRVAAKISSGQEICARMEKIAKVGIPRQENIDLVLGKKQTIEGKVGAIGTRVGTFTLANLHLRGLALGTEDLVYKDRCLKIEFPDLDKDGFRDLTLTGTLQRLDPKANPPVVGTIDYQRTFIYNPSSKTFTPGDGGAHPFVELLVR